MIDVGQLVTLNIKYGSSTKSLKVVAGAQIVAKVLFLKNSELGLKRIKIGVKEILNVSSISDEYVIEGLNYLKEVGKVTERLVGENKNWKLTDSAYKEVQHILDESRELLRGTLERNFSNKYDSETLQKWFISAATDFFGHFGDELVITISRKQKASTGKYKHIDDLLTPSIKKFNLESDSRELTEGFISFISSENTNDERYFMYLLFALFSARLVTADIGVDTFTLDELKNSTFLLDTNVIFALNLEKHKAAKTLKAVIRSLRKLNSSIAYLLVTREEYNRTISFIRANIIGTVRTGYSNEILKNSSDPFLKTAISRMCKTEDDYNTFFDSLADIPNTEEFGFKLKRDDSEISEEIVETAVKDTKLQQNIQQIKSKLYLERGLEAIPKPNSSLQHDSILIHTVENYRKHSKKYWVLSLDKSLQQCSIERTGPKSLPAVLSLDVLVQVLALNDSGGDIDSSEFAPLLASMILNECLPVDGAYSISDLKTLASANEMAVSFPQEDAEELLKFIAKNRLEGKSLKNSNAFNLELNRKIDKHIENYDERLQLSNRALTDANIKIKTFETSNEVLKQEFITETVRKRKRRLLVSLILKLLIFILVAPAVTYLIAVNIPIEHSAFVNYLLGSVPLILSIWIKLPVAVKEYKSSMDSVYEDSVHFVEKVIKEKTAVKL